MKNIHLIDKEALDALLPSKASPSRRKSSLRNRALAAAAAFSVVAIAVSASLKDEEEEEFKDEDVVDDLEDEVNEGKPPAKQKLPQEVTPETKKKKKEESFWSFGDLISRLTGMRESKEPVLPKPSSKPLAPKPEPAKTMTMVSATEAAKREKDILSKGKFTSEEAKHVKSISAYGLTTRATIGRQMPDYVKEEITRSAIAHGLDPERMIRVASLESGGNPNAVSGTGAVGVFQFTSATASDFGSFNRFDYRQNIEAGMQLTKRSVRSMERMGLSKKHTDSALSIYIAHQIGARGAHEVLSAPPKKKISSLSKSTQRNIRVNIGGKSATVGEYLEANKEALTKTYDRQVSSNRDADDIVPVTELAPAVSSPKSSPASAVSKASGAPSAVSRASGASAVSKAPERQEKAVAVPETKVSRAPSLGEPDVLFSPKFDPVAEAPREEVTPLIAASVQSGFKSPPQDFLRASNGMILENV